jgi:rod shape-determining protein MreC
VVTRSGPRNTRLLVVGLVAASLAIITLDFREGDSGPLASMGRAAQAFMAPLQEGVTTATRPVGDFFTGLAHLPSLARENQDLKQQLQDAQGRAAAYDATQALAGRYSDLLSIQQAFRGSVAADVIANGYTNFDYTITINKGSSDGIKQGQPVVTGTVNSPLLVGIVSSVTPISADVQLIIDRDWAAAGQLWTSKVIGLVSGQGDQDLRVDDVPLGTKFPTGDQPEYVYTVSYEAAGHHGLYPPGLLIGQVSGVYESDNALSDRVSVSPAVDFASLQAVLVLVPAPRSSP